MSHQRKKKFIDPEVQGALTRRLVLHWACFMGATLSLTLLLTWMSNPFEQSFTQTVSKTFAQHGLSLMILASLAPVFVFDAIKLSHRFSGPVFRLRQATRQVAEGNIPERVDFRDSDFWKELASDFNIILQRLRERDQPAAGQTAANPSGADTQGE